MSDETGVEPIIGRALQRLQVFRVSQDHPERLPETPGDTLKGRESKVPLALLDESVFGAVHGDHICERLLALVAGLAVLPNSGCDALLEGASLAGVRQGGWRVAG